MKHTPRFVAPSIALLAVSAAALVLAGPLDPPAGPIAPTYKTLADLEPRTAISPANTPGDADSLFKITQPGSYYLTSNVSVSSIDIGIEIAAPQVTIDLNGFTLHAGEEDGAYGIYTSQNQLRGITIRNGEISGFANDGINLGTFPAHDGTIDRVTCRLNGRHGVWVGNSFRLSGCSSISNVGDGFRTGRNSTLSECTASGNIGMNGFLVDTGSVIVSCIANTNQNTGFALNHAVSISHSSAFGNTHGIVAGENTVVSDCSAYDNRADGFVAASGSSISGCTARANGAVGIELAAECSVSACTATSNGSHGISAEDDSQIVGNTCTRNGTTALSGAGIYVNGAACRIDSNHVAGNDHGIRTLVADTLVVRNTARANSIANYSFAVPTESAQIITNPGANFVATNPWANFSF